MYLYPERSKITGNLLFAISPATLALFMLWVMKWQAHWVIWVASGFMFLITACVLIGVIFVFKTYMYIDETHVAYFAPLTKGGVWLYWDQVADALLRERKNYMSAIDHLLVLKGPGVRDIVMYNISNLSSKNEEYVLEMVRKKVNLRVQVDSPSI